MFIPRLTKPAREATAKDRERLDFQRYRAKQGECQPTPGLPYKQLLKIATEVCHRPITELTQMSLGEIEKVRKRVRR